MRTEIGIRSLDGLRLRGTLEKPNGRSKGSVLLVHGITVDRHEGGFYDFVASELLKSSYSSLRFDLRAHGESEGDYRVFSLSGVLSDIQAGALKLLKETQSRQCSIIAASFAGGLSVLATSLMEQNIRTLVLFNPLLNYRARFLEEKPFFDGVGLTPRGMKKLRQNGYLKHLSFRLSVPFIDELTNYRVERMPRLQIPVLTIHGTQDSMVPYNVARKYFRHNSRCRFISVRGADHGFYHPSDEEGNHPVTRKNWRFAIEQSLKWFRQ